MSTDLSQNNFITPIYTQVEKLSYIMREVSARKKETSEKAEVNVKFFTIHY